MRFWLLPALLLPSYAFADGHCPLAADLAAGIAFDIGEGDTEVYRAANDGVIEVLYTGSDGFQSRTLLGQGVYLLELIDMQNDVPDPSTRTTYTHSFTPAKMPVPKPNGAWVSEVAVLDQGRIDREVHDHRFGPAGQLTIGSCTYNKIRVTVRYDDEDKSVDTVDYLTDLGIGLLVGVAYDNGDGTRTDDVYSYLGIRALQPRDATDGRKTKSGD